MMDILERLRSVQSTCVQYTQGSDIMRDAANELETLRARIAELERPDFREMREMLRAMQAGELTVSRGIEILDMWRAGNWNNDMLPPVRQDLIEEDSMPVEIIDRLNLRVAELEKQRDGLAKDAERIDAIQSLGLSIDDQGWWDEEPTYQVYSIQGNRNDREWKRLGKGWNVRDAIDAALASVQEGGGK